MGSHSDFCERLNGAPPSFDMPDRELAYYLSTYRKTDCFIEQTYHMMRQSGSPFKLFYFSDHGLSHKMIGDAPATCDMAEIPGKTTKCLSWCCRTTINSASLSKHRSALLALSTCFPARQGLTLPIRNSLLPQRRLETKATGFITGMKWLISISWPTTRRHYSRARFARLPRWCCDGEKHPK